MPEFDNREFLPDDVFCVYHSSYGGEKFLFIFSRAPSMPTNVFMLAPDGEPPG
jgi:hypothetical protein